MPTHKPSNCTHHTHACPLAIPTTERPVAGHLHTFPSVPDPSAGEMVQTSLYMFIYMTMAFFPSPISQAHPRHTPLSLAQERMQDENLCPVWRNSVSRVSPMDTCSSAGSDFLHPTYFVKDLASHQNLKGKGGEGFSLCTRQPRAGSVPQTWPGAAHAPAPTPRASKAGSVTAPAHSPLPRPSSSLGRPGQDRDPGVGGLQISSLAHHLPGCFLL